MNEISITEILFLSTALFFIGVYGLLTRRNMITMLMAVELILNSVNINFVAFNKYLYPDNLDGLFFTIFIIAIAAAEARGFIFAAPMAIELNAGFIKIDFRLDHINDRSEWKDRCEFSSWLFD